MNTDIQTKNLSIAAFNSLPVHIKDWAASLQTTYLIVEINKRLGLKDEKTTIIPKLIFALITQDLDPLEFINELSYELGVSFQTAKSIAQDIENSVLKPVENELRKDVGVDVKLIYFGQPGNRNSVARFSPPSKPAETPLAPLPPPPIPLEAGRPEATVVPLSGTERPLTGPTMPKEPTVDLRSFEFSDSPFILHQEGQIYPSAPKEIPKARPSLNIKVQDYYEPNQEQKKPAPKPTSIRLETPNNSLRESTGQAPQSDQQNLATQFQMKTNTQNLAANINEQKTRVVHYSGPITPLNSLGIPRVSNQNTVDLRRLMKK